METLATLDLGTTPVVLRRAQGGDVPAIVALLAADQLGAARDGARTARDLAATRRLSAPSTATLLTCWW